MSHSTTAKKIHLPEAIRRWGNSTSITLLDPSVQIFTVPHIQGAIGYKVSAGCAVVFGDPVCDVKHIPELALAFQDFCAKQELRVVYATVSKRFADWAMGNISGAKVQVAEELVVDPKNDPSIGQEGRMLRKKIKHSISEGVIVQEYIGQDSEIEASIEQVGKDWLRGRKGPQIFLAHVHLFEERLGKRWFYARQHGKIVGALLLSQLEAREGWVLYLLMAAPEAANGTSENLVMHAIEKLRAEGCRYLSLGDTPAEKMGEITGLGAISSWIARNGFNASKKFFGLDGRRIYWKKYLPESKPSYLLFSQSKIGLREIVSLLRAMNVSLN